jgi:hypothetical protein
VLTLSARIAGFRGPAGRRGRAELLSALYCLDLGLKVAYRGGAGYADRDRTRAWCRDTRRNSSIAEATEAAHLPQHPDRVVPAVAVGVARLGHRV